MKVNRELIKKRLLFFMSNIVVAVLIISKILSNKLLPVFIEYGEYQCASISTRIINYVISNQISDELDNQIVIYNNSDVVSIDFNTSILNSISSNSIRKMQKYLYMLEHGELEEELVQFLGLNVGEDDLKKGIVYEIPFTRVFNNIFINNLGLSFPVRYGLIGDLKGEIITSIKEYGINNALLEINLEITAKTMVSIPMISEESVNVIVAPLVVKVIQGEIPDAFIGENILGEVR